MWEKTFVWNMLVQVQLCADHSAGNIIVLRSCHFCFWNAITHSLVQKQNKNYQVSDLTFWSMKLI
jgi:hypothetical protein